MRKVLLGLVAIFGTMSAYAQTSDWKLETVKPFDTVLGYIYHTNAVGTELGKDNKFVVGLRLVCSAKTDPIADPPFIALHWRSPVGTTSTFPAVKVDDRFIDQGQWVKESPSTLTKAIPEAKQLLQAMKLGHSISFEWIGEDGGLRKTIFNLRGFNDKLPEFNKSCDIK